MLFLLLTKPKPHLVQQQIPRFFWSEWTLALLPDPAPFFSFISHVAMMKRTVDFTSKQINLGGLFKINNLKIIIRYAENLRVPLYTLY